jgi:hypothetical protein
VATDLVIGIFSFLLTLMVFSYLIGDNPVFRVAVYIFIGAAAGYAAAVVWWQVLWARMMIPLLQGGFYERAIALVALLLGILLFMKFTVRTSRLGAVPMAILVGVGAALAVGGAVVGTILPQTQAVINEFKITGNGFVFIERLIFALLLVMGTISTLVYFHYGAKATPEGPRRPWLVKALAWVGQIFIAITFGVLFAGVFSASLTALIDRVRSLLEFTSKILF